MRNQIINAKIVTPEAVITGKVLVFDENILGIFDTPENNIETIDAKGNYVIPGMIDLHIHGYLGADASDGDEDGLRKMSAGIFKNGVTSYLPTTMSLPYESLERAFDAARKLKSDRHAGEAEVLGVHAEGPFINPERKGAMKEEYIKAPDSEFALKHKDIIKILTLAPEMDKDFSEIQRIANNSDTVISVGHTSADFETANAAFSAGITHATHLFNAMTGITHREPGVAGAALFSPEISCELICDGFHINPALFAPIAKLKGSKLNVITDCMRAGGMPDGEYELGGQTVKVNGIKCLLPNGTIAGSVLKMNEALRNVICAGVPLVEAVNAVTLYPAQAIGADGERGAISEGMLADLCICDENINILQVFKSGKREY